MPPGARKDSFRSLASSLSHARRTALILSSTESSLSNPEICAFLNPARLRALIFAHLPKAGLNRSGRPVDLQRGPHHMYQLFPLDQAKIGWSRRPVSLSLPRYHDFPFVTNSLSTGVFSLILPIHDVDNFSSTHRSRLFTPVHIASSKLLSFDIRSLHHLGYPTTTIDSTSHA